MGRDAGKESGSGEVRKAADLGKMITTKSVKGFIKTNLMIIESSSFGREM